MVNRHRGEVAAIIDGREYVLCLTLGALAELEDFFGAGDLAELAARLGAGPLTARQLAAILAAGLRGGGHEVETREVEAMRLEGGAAGSARLAAELLRAAFGPPAGSGSASQPETTGAPPNPWPPQVG